MINILLENGCVLHVQSIYGETALDIAKKYYSYIIVEVLEPFYQNY